jgi:hypothetical protein
MREGNDQERGEARRSGGSSRVEEDGVDLVVLQGRVVLHPRMIPHVS